MRCDRPTRCYFNVCSKAEMGQFNPPCLPGHQAVVMFLTFPSVSAHVHLSMHLHGGIPDRLDVDFYFACVILLRIADQRKHVVLIASLGAANAASSLAQHPLFRPGMLPGSPLFNPLFPWHQPWHAMLQHSMGSADHMGAVITGTNNDDSRVCRSPCLTYLAQI